MANDTGKKIQARCICGKRHFDVPAPGGRIDLPEGAHLDIHKQCKDRTCGRLVNFRITCTGIIPSEITPTQTDRPDQRPQLHN